ncbi:MAG TPA: Ig-like domain-containing protein [Candidatus Thermoplasmatota archaeon]|nr:Ig-like domain-containing protein [Candidatus Thermoplasmatota archaeon]
MKAAAAVWLGALVASTLAPAGLAVPEASRETTALEPLAVSVPYIWRTMEGLETHLISPRPTYDHLHDVAFAPDGHMALAVGSHNTLMAWDSANGTARLLRNGTLGNLYAVAWSADSTTALAVGWNGSLVLYSSGAISDLPAQGAGIWQGVAFVPGAGFLVVGQGGSMFFLNGGLRTNVTSPTTNDLMAVAWNGVGGKALAVGRGGVAVEVTPGGAAAALASIVSEDLRAVAFEADTGKGLIAGGVGVLLSYSAGVLSNETHAPTEGGYFDLDVRSSAEPAVVALRNDTTGALLFTNATFSNLVALPPFPPVVEAVARSPTLGYALAVGSFGMVVTALDNGSTQNVSPPLRPYIQDASWRGTGDLALLVGFNGTVLLYNRTSDSTSALAVPNSNASLRGVSWAPNGTEALIVGASTFWRFDLATTNISEPIGPTALDLYGVKYRPQRPEALAVGTGGFIGRWDGSNLTRISSGSIGNSFLSLAWHLDSAGVGDYAYTAGANLVARIDPPGVVSTTTRIGTYFGVAFLGEDVWIVGDPRQIAFYNSALGIWDNLTLPADFSTVHLSRAVADPSGERILVVGNQTLSAFVNGSRILRFDTGFLVPFTGVEYNPQTREPLYFGGSSIAFTMREGVFPNLAPVAVISSPAQGSNWTTADTVFFDASASFDSDGDAMRVTWWDNATGFLTAALSFGAQLAAGDHNVTVFVDDGRGHNVSASVRVHVEEAQYPPVAQISGPAPGSNFTDDDDITFNGATSFDPNAGDALSYAWSSDLDGPLGGSPIVVVRLSVGTHTVRLTVTDSTGRSSNATVAVSVRLGDVPPSPAISSPNPGARYHSNIPVEFNASGTTDPDSPTLSFEWLVDGLSAATGPLVSYPMTEGPHTVTLRVSDGQKSSELAVSIVVEGPLDLPPRFLSIFPGNGTVLSGLAVLNGTMEADLVGPVRFVEFRVEGGEWLRALNTVAWTGVLDTALYTNGPVNITFRASDGASVTEAVRTYLIDNPFVNAPPALDILTPRPGAVLRGSVTVAGSVDDPDGANTSVEFRLAGGAWQNATVSASGSWSASFETAPFANGPLVFEARAFDGLNYSALAVLTVNVDNPQGGGGFLPGLEAAAAIAALGAVAWGRGPLQKRRPK